MLDFNSPQLTERKLNKDGRDFLVRSLKQATDLQTFDGQHLAAFNNNNLKMDLERTTCTSNNARKHTRAYYQVQLWVQALFRDASFTNGC